MPNDSAAVRSLLKDVTFDGVIIVEKKKLLWLLGWSQDRAGAWAELLTLWKEIGQDPASLRGCEIWGKIVLTMEKKAEYSAVPDWAK
jgi:hypothetical protein